MEIKWIWVLNNRRESKRQSSQQPPPPPLRAIWLEKTQTYSTHDLDTQGGDAVCGVERERGVGRFLRVHCRFGSDPRFSVGGGGGSHKEHSCFPRAAMRHVTTVKPLLEVQADSTSTWGPATPHPPPDRSPSERGLGSHTGAKA